MRTVIGPAKIDQRETIQTTDVFKTVHISFLMFFNELIILTIFLEEGHFIEVANQISIITDKSAYPIGKK